MNALQKRGDPHVIDGEILDTRKALPDLTPDEQTQLESIKSKLKADIRPQVEQAKTEFIEEMAAVIAAGSSNETEAEAHDTARRAVENGVLMGDYPVTLKNGECLTVSALLDDPGKYHGKLTLDPIEPEYLNNKVVGKLYLSGSRPSLHSFAHGGRTFKLMRQPRLIELVKGKTHEAVNQVMEIMREMPDVFDFDQQLVTVNDGRAVPMDEYRLLHWLGGIAQFWRWAKTPQGILYKVNEDPPQKLAKTILSLRRERRLKPLKAVITAPVITANNYIVDKPGYCKRTQLFLDTPDSLPTIPENVTEEMVRDAVHRLMKSFKTFPFCTKLDEAVFLSALLTSVLRPVLPTAPCYAIDAPIQGSGKTLLAVCLSILATGEKATIWPHTAGRDDEEVRKRLFTALRAGERALLWDNVTGTLNSAAIAALLTSEIYTDRLLGKSEAPTVPNRALFLMTGNNLTLASDLPRRVLKCRIDPKSERPYARQFDLDPAAYTMNNRQRMAADVLTIVRGWLQSSEYMINNKAPGRMASFEEWDDLVRQPVAWMNRSIMPGDFGDVMDVVDASQLQDPEQTALGELLAELQKKFKDSVFTAKDVCQAMRVDESDDDTLVDCFGDFTNNKVLNARTIGRVLAFRTGRIVNNLVLREVPKTNVRRWSVSTCPN